LYFFIVSNLGILVYLRETFFLLHRNDMQQSVTYK